MSEDRTFKVKRKKHYYNYDIVLSVNDPTTQSVSLSFTSSFELPPTSQEHRIVGSPMSIQVLQSISVCLVNTSAPKPGEDGIPSLEAGKYYETTIKLRGVSSEDLESITLRNASDGNTVEFGLVETTFDEGTTTPNPTGTTLNTNSSRGKCYKLSFTPSNHGKHIMEFIRKGGKSISGSPLEFDVKPDESKNKNFTIPSFPDGIFDASGNKAKCGFPFSFQVPVPGHFEVDKLSVLVIDPEGTERRATVLRSGSLSTSGKGSSNAVASSNSSGLDVAVSTVSNVMGKSNVPDVALSSSLPSTSNVSAIFVPKLVGEHRVNLLLSGTSVLNELWILDVISPTLNISSDFVKPSTPYFSKKEIVVQKLVTPPSSSVPSNSKQPLKPSISDITVVVKDSTNQVVPDCGKVVELSDGEGYSINMTAPKGGKYAVNVYVFDDCLTPKPILVDVQESPDIKEDKVSSDDLKGSGKISQSLSMPTIPQLKSASSKGKGLFKVGSNKKDVGHDKVNVSLDAETVTTSSSSSSSSSTHKNKKSFFKSSKRKSVEYKSSKDDSDASTSSSSKKNTGKKDFKASISATFGFKTKEKGQSTADDDNQQDDDNNGSLSKKKSFKDRIKVKPNTLDVDIQVSSPLPNLSSGVDNHISSGVNKEIDMMDNEDSPSEIKIKPRKRPVRSKTLEARSPPSYLGPLIKKTSGSITSDDDRDPIIGSPEFPAVHTEAKVTFPDYPPPPTVDPPPPPSPVKYLMKNLPSLPPTPRDQDLFNVNAEVNWAYGSHKGVLSPSSSDNSVKTSTKKRSKNQPTRAHTHSSSGSKSLSSSRKIISTPLSPSSNTSIRVLQHHDNSDEEKNEEEVDIEAKVDAKIDGKIDVNMNASGSGKRRSPKRRSTTVSSKRKERRQRRMSAPVIGKQRMDLTPNAAPAVTVSTSSAKPKSKSNRSKKIKRSHTTRDSAPRKLKDIISNDNDGNDDAVEKEPKEPEVKDIFLQPLTTIAPPTNTKPIKCRLSLLLPKFEVLPEGNTADPEKSEEDTVNNEESPESKNVPSSSSTISRPGTPSKPLSNIPYDVSKLSVTVSITESASLPTTAMNGLDPQLNLDVTLTNDPSQPPTFNPVLLPNILSPTSNLFSLPLPPPHSSPSDAATTENYGATIVESVEGNYIIEFYPPQSYGIFDVNVVYDGRSLFNEPIKVHFGSHEPAYALNKPAPSQQQLQPISPSSTGHVCAFIISQITDKKGKLISSYKHTDLHVVMTGPANLIGRVVPKENLLTWVIEFTAYKPGIYRALIYLRGRPITEMLHLQVEPELTMNIPSFNPSIFDNINPDVGIDIPLPSVYTSDGIKLDYQPKDIKVEMLRVADHTITYGTVKPASNPEGEFNLGFRSSRPSTPKGKVNSVVNSTGVPGIPSVSSSGSITTSSMIANLKPRRGGEYESRILLWNKPLFSSPIKFTFPEPTTLSDQLRDNIKNYKIKHRRTHSLSNDDSEGDDREESSEHETSSESEETKKSRRRRDKKKRSIKIEYDYHYENAEDDKDAKTGELRTSHDQPYEADFVSQLKSMSEAAKSVIESINITVPPNPKLSNIYSYSGEITIAAEPIIRLNEYDWNTKLKSLVTSQNYVEFFASILDSILNFIELMTYNIGLVLNMSLRKKIKLQLEHLGKETNEIVSIAVENINSPPEQRKASPKIPNNNNNKNEDKSLSLQRSSANLKEIVTNMLDILKRYKFVLSGGNVRHSAPSIRISKDVPSPKRRDTLDDLNVSHKSSKYALSRTPQSSKSSRSPGSATINDPEFIVSKLVNFLNSSSARKVSKESICRPYPPPQNPSEVVVSFSTIIKELIDNIRASPSSKHESVESAMMLIPLISKTVLFLRNVILSNFISSLYWNNFVISIDTFSQTLIDMLGLKLNNQSVEMKLVDFTSQLRRITSTLQLIKDSQQSTSLTVGTTSIESSSSTSHLNFAESLVRCN
eukprot:TRINITY_DN561_c1_g6_i1.p1 TRINITY_DN561_c1_g6~~TRINITY_DN561_c1_g6_i1.p1  ORF type:complete len:1984 (-),score=647.56 TRINITY_DN561_c1_g6_i1:79-5937(-)